MRGRLEKPRVKAYGFIMQVMALDTNMGKESDLTDVDRLKMTCMLGNGKSMLGYGKSTLEMAKNMNRDHRTINKFVVFGMWCRNLRNPKQLPEPRVRFGSSGVRPGWCSTGVCNGPEHSMLCLSQNSL